MAYAPYTHLQAMPDFATFQFESPTLPEPTIRQIKFNGHHGGRIYYVELSNLSPYRKDDPSWRDSKEFFCTVLTTLQIIEIYSERYPERVLLLSADTTIKALVFGAILGRFRHLLASRFKIDPASGESKPPETFLLRRKPYPFFTIHTIESTQKGTSRMFHTRYSIELDKTIRVGVSLPAD